MLKQIYVKTKKNYDESINERINENDNFEKFYCNDRVNFVDTVLPI